MSDQKEELYKHLADLFKHSLRTKHSLHQKKKHLMSELKHKLNTRNTYSTLCKANETIEERPDGIDNREYPIIMGNAATRMSILSLGAFVTESCGNASDYSTRDVIFPVGFKAKRRFLRHKTCCKKSGDGKVFYFCDIKQGPVFEISCLDGSKWSGDNVWSDFVADIDGQIDIKSVEEFFGLTHPSLVKIIEEMGDISIFKNYVPLQDRK